MQGDEQGLQIDACERNSMRAASQDVTLGHGPRQLTWLRRSIEAFRHAEQQRVQLRLDVVRAARLAGLI